MPALIEIKSLREVEKIRKASRIATAILNELAKMVSPGLASVELDRQMTIGLSRYPGAQAAFLGYRGFPANLCVSVNSEVIHGVPSAQKKIREGDLVSLDLGVLYDGYYGDCATTVVVGQATAPALKLAQVTQEALSRAIGIIRPGIHVGDIGWTIQSFVESHKMNVIRDFVGHGIGRQLHEEPAIANWGSSGVGAELFEGMTIAIEPMVTLGGGEVVVSRDGWTAKTKDNALAAHFEHTVLVTKTGCEILTRNE